MVEFNPNQTDPHQHEVVILQTIQPYHALFKANRLLLVLVFVLLATVFLMGLLLLPRQSTLEEIARRRTEETVYATQNPVLTAEINTLKGQMFGLVSGSIESKIKSLEETIRRGSLTESLDTLQQLKSEVKILSTYSKEPAINSGQIVVDQNVIKELSELKSLIYLTFVSCGLMIAALAGVWLRYSNRLPHYKTHGFLSREK